MKRPTVAGGADPAVLADLRASAGLRRFLGPPFMTAQAMKARSGSMAKPRQRGPVGMRPNISTDHAAHLRLHAKGGTR